MDMEGSVKSMAETVKKFYCSFVSQAPTDQLQKATDKLQAPTDQLQSATDQLPAPTDQLQRPTDKLQAPTNQLQAPTDQLQAPTNQLQRATDQLQEPADQLQRTTDQLQPPTNQLQRATDQLQEPADQLQRTTDQLQPPTNQLQRATDQLQEPADQLQRTTDQLQPPRNQLQAPTDQLQKTDQLQAPTNQLQAPTDQLQRTGQLQAPTDQLQTPTDQLKAPTDQLQRTKDQQPTKVDKQEIPAAEGHQPSFVQPPTAHVPLCCSIRMMIYFMTHITTAYTISLFLSFHFAWVCMTRDTTDQQQGNQTTVTSAVDEKLLDWDNHMKSILFSAYPLGAVIFIVLSGWVIDKFGSRVVCACMMLLTAIVNALIPSVAFISPELVFVLRLILGCSAMGYPLAYNVVSHWVPKDEMGLAMSVIFSGFNTGAFFCNLLAGYQCHYLGYEWTFYSLSIFGILHAAVWLAIFRTDPANHPSITDNEKAYILEHRLKQHKPGHKKSTPWKALLSSPPVWATTTSIFCDLVCVNTLGMFTPTLFDKVLLMDLRTNGLCCSLVFLGNFVGRVPVGPISDALKKRCAPTKLVKSFNSFGICSIIVSCVGMAAILQRGMDAPFPVFLLFLALFGDGTTTAGAIKTPLLIAPHHSGVIGALGNSAVYMSAMIVPPVVVAILSEEGSVSSWRIVFIMQAATAVFGGIVFLIFGSGDAQPWDKMGHEDEANKPKAEQIK